MQILSIQGAVEAMIDSSNRYIDQSIYIQVKELYNGIFNFRKGKSIFSCALDSECFKTGIGFQFLKISTLTLCQPHLLKGLPPDSASDSQQKYLSSGPHSKGYHQQRVA